MLEKVKKQFKHALACVSVIAAASALGMASGKAVNAAESTKTVNVTLDQNDLSGVFVVRDADMATINVSYKDETGSEKKLSKTLAAQGFVGQHGESADGISPSECNTSWKDSTTASFDIPSTATDIKIGAQSLQDIISVYSQVTAPSTADLNDSYVLDVAVSNAAQTSTFKVSAAPGQTSSQIDFMNEILSHNSRELEMLYLMAQGSCTTNGRNTQYGLCYTPICKIEDISLHYLPSLMDETVGFMIDMKNSGLAPFVVKGQFREITDIGTTFTQSKPAMTIGLRAQKFRVFSNSDKINQILKTSTLNFSSPLGDNQIGNYDRIIDFPSRNSVIFSDPISLANTIWMQYLGGLKQSDVSVNLTDPASIGAAINWSEDVSSYDLTYHFSASVDSYVPVNSITEPGDFALYIEAKDDSAEVPDENLVSVNFPETEDPMYAHVPNYDTLQTKDQTVVCNAFDTPEEEGSSTKAFPVTKTTVELPKDATLYVTLDAEENEMDPSEDAPVSAATARPVSALRNFTFKVRKKGAASSVSGSTSFKKVLDVGELGAVPNATFTFGIKAGEAKTDTKNSEYRVYAGLDADQVTVGSAEFTSADTRDEGTTKVTKTVPVDFSKITFPEPGIYRYVLTENATALTGIINDENPDRILDVLVQAEDAEDGSQKCTVKSYILHKTADVIALTDADLGEDKSEGYENQYQASSLTISKQVSGNQASHDQYFKFTVNLTGGIAGAEYQVNLDNADASPEKNSATKYDNMSNPATFTAGEDGSATATFYLQHGQSVRIDGIAKGTSYDVSEENLDYTPSVELTGDTEADTSAENAVSDTSLDADTTVAFTNSRQGTIPTGVILAMAPYLALGFAAACGMILYMVCKKKKETGEDK